jgi:hypothetical protein
MNGLAQKKVTLASLYPKEYDSTWSNLNDPEYLLTGSTR